MRKKVVYTRTNIRLGGVVFSSMMKYVVEEVLQDRRDSPDIGSIISLLVVTSFVFMFEVQKNYNLPLHEIES